MTTTIDLLRHGEVRGGLRLRGQRDDPLSETGWQQMRDKLNSTPPWNNLTSSPLQRCSAFSREISKQFNLQLTEDRRFGEIGFGDWEGKLLTELYEEEGEKVRSFWNDPASVAAPGGEPYSEFEERVAAAWKDLLEINRGRHCLLVAHGGTIRVILRQILNLPVQSLFRIDVPFACLSRTQQTDGESPRLVFHGGHL